MYSCISSRGTPGNFHVEMDGVNVTGQMQIPDTNWALTTISKSGVQLSAGQHVMRVVAETNAGNGYTGDFDTFSFTLNAAGGATTAATTIQWLVMDQLGTPRMIADQSGSLAGIRRHDYLPFGEELQAGSGGRSAQQGYAGDDVRQKFTQKERDGETGLDYFINRYYSSSQGRFINADPIPMTSMRPIDPQQLNLYAYVRNNPLHYTDQEGLDLYAEGPEADRYRQDLERATGLKLKIDAKTNKVTIADAPDKLSEVGEKIKGIIEDSKASTTIVAIKGDKENILVDQFYGGGEQWIDYKDVDKVSSKPGGITPESEAVHATVEAYEGRYTSKEFIQSGGLPDPSFHETAIRYENMVREQQGLGARTTERSEVHGKNIVIIVDLTTHIEKITVSGKRDGVIKKVEVIKKK